MQIFECCATMRASSLTSRGINHAHYLASLQGPSFRIEREPQRRAAPAPIHFSLHRAVGSLSHGFVSNPELRDAARCLSDHHG